MTRVGFYVVQAADQTQRLQVAVRLADKAFQQGHRIFINAADEAQARTLDELLWTFRPASFLPHGLHGQEQSESIAIGWGQEPLDHNDLLINLQLGIPGFFSRFQPGGRGRYPGPRQPGCPAPFLDVLQGTRLPTRKARPLAL